MNEHFFNFKLNSNLGYHLIGFRVSEKLLILLAFMFCVNLCISQSDIGCIISNNKNCKKFSFKTDNKLIKDSFYPHSDSMDYLNISFSDSIIVYRFDDVQSIFYNGSRYVLNGGESLIRISYNSEEFAIKSIGSFLMYLESSSFSIGSSLLLKGGVLVSRLENQLFMYIPSDKIKSSERYNFLIQNSNTFIKNGSSETYMFFGGKIIKRD